MFVDEELMMLSNFFNIQSNKENVLLHMDSKGTTNKWILIDFSKKYKERYGIYYKSSFSKIYRPFNQVNSLSSALNLISNYESR